MSQLKNVTHELGRLGVVGDSPAFWQFYSQIGCFAHSKAPVLLQGETGTGKEMAARSLHYLGPRCDKPFVPLNCGAVPASMFESELFGHTQGAYTDAKSQRHGLIAQANKGTLFLDEVDGLCRSAQVALLRFLEDQQYRPLGSDALIQADISVIAASNVDLAEKVAAGEFREDLLFRLATIVIEVPSLRDRRQDIAILAKHYVYYLSELYGDDLKTLDPAFLAWLEQQPWPGNIRQLQNFLHREFLLTEGTVIGRDRASGTSVATRPPFSLAIDRFDLSYDDLKRALVQDFEYQYLHKIMQQCHGNISEAARCIKKDRRAVGRLLEKHGIDKSSYRS